MTPSLFAPSAVPALPPVEASAPSLPASPSPAWPTYEQIGDPRPEPAIACHLCGQAGGITVWRWRVDRHFPGANNPTEADVLNAFLGPKPGERPEPAHTFPPPKEKREREPKAERTRNKAQKKGRRL